MERRFRRIYISFDIVPSYGKGFNKALLAVLPQHTEILFKEESLEFGCLHMLLYNGSFDLLESNQVVPVWHDFELKPKQKQTILTPVN